MAPHSSILAWRIPMDRGAWRATTYGVATHDSAHMHTHTRHMQEPIRGLPWQ